MNMLFTILANFEGMNIMIEKVTLLQQVNTVHKS